MENRELVRVVYYVQDCFENPHVLRKSSIGYMPKGMYEECEKGNGPTCFDVGSDYFAKGFPQLITK